MSSIATLLRRKLGRCAGRAARRATPRAWTKRSARRCRAARAGRLPPIEDELQWSTGPVARDKGLGAEKPIPSAAFTGWAMDTLNGGPMLRSEIVLFQRGEA